MSIFRSHANTPVVTPTYTGLQVQTASSSLPIPIVYGVNKLGPNLIWAANFQAHAQYSQSSGGKGGGGSAAQVSGYTYTTALIFGLCEGPISAIGSVWNGQSLYALTDLDLSLFSGTTPQSAWSFLAAAFPAASLGYQGTAYAAASSFDLGSSATVSALNFEIYGVLCASGTANAFDADPARIVGDFLINPQYGVGFPAASIDATTLYGTSGGASYQTYCQAAGLALSPCLTDQEAANSILSRWLQLTNTAAVWSGGKLKFVPYGDAQIIGGVTFNPNITPVYNLTDDDFVLAGEDDPLNVARSDPYAAYNIQRVEILDRTNQYSATPVEARDQNAIELYGLRLASTITAHEICDQAVAATVAQLILQRGLYIRNTYTFKLSWEYCLLEPMDLVTVTDAGLGLANTPVRITEIEEDDTGVLTVTAEEFPGGTATAVAYPVAGATNNPINRNIVPASVNTPVIFEPPPALTGGGAQVWVALSGGTGGVADPNWGGANVWISVDNISYVNIGSVSMPARQGVLTGALGVPGTGNPDLGNTLAVGMAQSGGVLAPATNLDAQNAVTLSIVGRELVAYANATLTGTNAYSLTYLERGLYGSVAVAHTVGAPFARLDAAVFKYALPDAYVGTNLYLKFQSFNVFGEGLQDISTCALFTYAALGSGTLGPVAQALSIGTALDFGLASTGINETDDYGIASDPYTTLIDLGLASA